MVICKILIVILVMIMIVNNIQCKNKMNHQHQLNKVDYNKHKEDSIHKMMIVLKR